MGEIIEMADFRKKLEKRSKQLKVEQVLNSIAKAVVSNKELTAGLIVTGIPVVGFLAKTLIREGAAARRQHSIQKEEKQKALRYYDNSLRKWWDLKRPLTNDDLMRIKDKKNAGEKLADILSELQVLK